MPHWKAHAQNVLRVSTEGTTSCEGGAGTGVIRNALIIPDVKAYVRRVHFDHGLLVHNLSGNALVQDGAKQRVALPLIALHRVARC